ncbi:uncharacterized protein LOC5511133 isoform X2 [Nematostella vectensis]|uniref:uncharacterized protein LOC5511133 isoform X2 n=1 Tax=Nematostella vectensis TaxID=45351 RepID=UPI00138FB5A9|nr:uncharacterized protein LOC5511133 isoform X2 [Nematostella vectensis]
MAHRQSADTSLRCKNPKCDSHLAAIDFLVLGTIPPSQMHLAVKPGCEIHLGNVRKVPNHDTDVKKVARMPFKIVCARCDTPIGSVTIIEGQQVWCFKVETVYVLARGQRIENKRLKNISERLKEIGVTELKLTQRRPIPTELLYADQSSQALIYCDASRLTEDHILHLAKDTPRDYQRELFISAIQRNSLVYLPTGSGKTLVAAMVISCMLKLNPDKMAVFVVDRINLAHQQSAYIQKQCPKLNVKTLVAGNDPNPNHEAEMSAVLGALARKQIDVLVLTHQILLNHLADDEGLIRMPNICALVFDEAHHCIGNHPYNKIMSDFYVKTADKYKPLVLGLSASPAGSTDLAKTRHNLQCLLENLCASPVLPVNSRDLEMYTNLPESFFSVVPLTMQQQRLNDSLEAFLQSASRKLEDMAEGCFGELRDFHPSMPNFRGGLRTLIGKCHLARNIKGHALGELMTHLLAALEMNSVLGLTYAVECLKECFQVMDNASTPMEMEKKALTRHDPDLSRVRDAIRELDQGRYDCLGIKQKDKFQFLLEELTSFTDKTKQDDNSRGIIFVRMRRTAYKLCERLKGYDVISEYLNPTAIVGHGGGDGMSWYGEQEVILKSFRTGRIKLLISTSVLEEGLDVPVCNLVVRFDSTMNLKSLVQSRGRASRRSDSHFVVLCSNGKEKQEVDELKLKEANMKESMRLFYSTSNRSSQATRYACTVGLPGVSVTCEDTKMESDEMRRVPKVSKVGVVVHNIQSQQQIKDFFKGSFSVSSCEQIKHKRELWSMLESTESDQGSDGVHSLRFILSETAEKKARSGWSTLSESIRNAWCSRMRGHEPDAWLELEMRKARPSDPVEQVVADSLQLGFFRQRNEFCSQWPNQQDLAPSHIRLLFQHDLKTLAIVFTIGELLYEFEIRYSELENFIVVNDSPQNNPGRNVHAFLSIKNPPRIFKSLEGDLWCEVGNQEEGYSSGEESTDEEEDDDDSDADIGLDVGNLVEGSGDGEEMLDVEEEEPQEERQESHEDDDESNQQEEYDQQQSLQHPLLLVLDNITQWDRVSRVPDDRHDAIGKCNVLKLKISGSCVYSWESVSESLRRWDKRTYHARVDEVQGYIPIRFNVSPSLSDEVKYAAACLVSTHPVLPGRVSVDFFSGLRNKPNKTAVGALNGLTKVLDRNLFCQPKAILEDLLAKPWTSELPAPGHCAYLKRLILTPTRLIFRPPEIMQKNRVLRNYNPGDFLCVNIRDEDFSRVTSTSANLSPVLNHLKEVMDQGINVSGTRYEFLGCSNSQLRNHSCWFVKSDCDPSAIRRWMGDFSSIRCVGTYVSRMGQCFSTSLDTVGITVDGIECLEKDDIQTEEKSYTFTDGIGGISSQLARKVTIKIGKDFIPSAFQIRYAGCKGVLAVDKSLGEKQLFCRPSMRKFQSSHRRLEVLQTSRPQAVYLNHQVIMLLSNLGISDDVFMSLLEKTLDNLGGTLLDERLAMRQLSSAVKRGISYRDLFDAGVHLTVEPFFRSLNAAVYRDRLMQLLMKARMQLPLESARLMMGVVDETGVLEYGQVFVQYSAASNDPRSDKEFELSDKRVLKGPVVVTRNPCLHPGDVRRLVAIDTPKLRHLVDCVVFPKTGQRPHPSEMAGGDLDGDLYFVCWYKPLIPSQEISLYDPMDYKAPPKREDRTEITSADMTQYIVDYIRMDILGVIDNSHKALADKLKKGVQSEECLFLAEAHSYAVDAPKTGQWPDLNGLKLPKSYPDFMMKTDKPTYRSKKLLGKLYRSCRSFKKLAEDSAPKEITKPCLDPNLLVAGYRRFLDEAKNVYQEYCLRLDHIMGIYGINTEAELFSGCFRLLYQRLSRERTEVAEVVSGLLQDLRKLFRGRFFEEFGLDGTCLMKQHDERVLQKASAWYYVSYAAEETTHQQRFLSLPWLVDEIMALIRIRSRSHTFLPDFIRNTNAPPENHAVSPREAELSDSLFELVKKDKEMLLMEYKKRCSSLTQIQMSLRRAGRFHLALFGSSATFLLREDSDVDVVVLTSECLNTGMIQQKVSRKDQLRLLRYLQPYLKNLFKRIRLVDRATVPVVLCQKFKPVIPAPDAFKAPFDFSASREGLLKAALLTSYIKSFPGLLPILRFLLIWGHRSGLTGHRGHVGINTNALVFITLAFCVSKGFIQELKKETIDAAMKKMVNPGQELTEWENVLGNLTGVHGRRKYMQVTLNGHTLGGVLMSFLAEHSRINILAFTPSIAAVAGKTHVRYLVSKQQLDRLSEHMQRAQMSLALKSDLADFLCQSATEMRRALPLSNGVSCLMREIRSRLIRCFLPVA